jgi:hypothetical protein
VGTEEERARRRRAAERDTAFEEAARRGEVADPEAWSHAHGFAGNQLRNLYGLGGLYSTYGPGVSANYIYDIQSGKKLDVSTNLGGERPGAKQGGDGQWHWDSNAAPPEAWEPMTPEELHSVQMSGAGTDRSWEGRGISYADILASEGWGAERARSGRDRAAGQVGNSFQLPDGRWVREFGSSLGGPRGWQIVDERGRPVAPFTGTVPGGTSPTTSIPGIGGLPQNNMVEFERMFRQLFGSSPEGFPTNREERRGTPRPGMMPASSWAPSRNPLTPGLGGWESGWSSGLTAGGWTPGGGVNINPPHQPVAGSQIAGAPAAAPPAQAPGAVQTPGMGSMAAPSRGFDFNSHEGPLNGPDDKFFPNKPLLPAVGGIRSSTRNPETGGMMFGLPWRDPRQRMIAPPSRSGQPTMGLGTWR